MIPESSNVRALFGAHPRTFDDNRYVYPVLSRRAGGISIGVNLNPDQVCNFRCVYCQVERTNPRDNVPPPNVSVDLDRLEAELCRMIEQVTSKTLYELPKFSSVPADMRRLNDIALSGDGEPTLCRQFDKVLSACAQMRRSHRLNHARLVLFTNASMFHHKPVRRGLSILHAHGGEIWAKLDAGTETAYRAIACSAVPFQRILDNLSWAAQAGPIVVQSLFMRTKGEPPPQSEQEAYCQRLVEILQSGGQIRAVQLYTIARPPAEAWVTPLSRDALDPIADLIRHRTGLPVEVYGP